MNSRFNTFYKSNNSRYGGVVRANRVDERFISYDPNSNPCITNPPRDVCYRFTVLPGKNGIA